MEEVKLSFRELIFYIVTANVILGVLFGTISLFLGLKMNRRGLGVIGLVVTMIGGAVLGLFLSYPLTLLFMWLITRTPNEASTPAEVSSVPM
jgi:hypothetical protein